jgi:hypothetical protein
LSFITLQKKQGKMSKIDLKSGIIIGGLIAVAALSRLVDHPFNFTPVLAIIIFSVAVIKNRTLKIVIPFVVILLSDLMLQFKTGYGFHSGTWLVYGAYILVGLVAFGVLKKISILNVVAGTLFGSIVFFLVTNFAFFYPVAVVSNPTLGQYSHDISGIITSYEAGLPFFRNMITGDMFYSAILFGTYALAQSFGLQRKVS